MYTHYFSKLQIDPGSVYSTKSVKFQNQLQLTNQRRANKTLRVHLPTYTVCEKYTQVHYRLNILDIL